ncbi:MAG TPA: hypothetical protein VGG20_03595 [Thermoanaerobaculia bacterium]|jgi:hypothetical protein
MKKLPIVLACTLLMFVLVPSLHAAQPAPAAQVDLAQIFAPASSTATASLAADPAKTMPSDLFLPEPKLACTVTVCIRECNDCPAGHHGICVSTSTCTCGCS